MAWAPGKSGFSAGVRSAKLRDNGEAQALLRASKTDLGQRTFGVQRDGLPQLFKATAEGLRSEPPKLVEGLQVELAGPEVRQSPLFSRGAFELPRPGDGGGSLLLNRKIVGAFAAVTV